LRTLFIYLKKLREKRKNRKKCIAIFKKQLNDPHTKSQIIESTLLYTLNDIKDKNDIGDEFETIIELLSPEEKKDNVEKSE